MDKIPLIGVLSKLDKKELSEMILHNANLSGYFLFNENTSNQDKFSVCNKAKFEDTINFLVNSKTQSNSTISNLDKLRIILVEQGKRFQDNTLKDFIKLAEAFITSSIENKNENSIGIIRNELKVLVGAFEQAEKTVLASIKSAKTVENEKKTDNVELEVTVQVDDEFKTNSGEKENKKILSKSTPIGDAVASSGNNKISVVNKADGVKSPPQFIVTIGSPISGNKLDSGNLKKKSKLTNMSSTLNNKSLKKDDAHKTYIVSNNPFDSFPYLDNRIDDNVEEWLFKVEVIAKRDQIGNDQILELVYHKLKGSAYEIASKMLDENEYDWDKFKRKFLDRRTKDAQFNILCEITSLKMADLNYNFKAYLNKFQSLVNRLIEITEEYKIFCFINGLPVNIRNDVINQNGDRELSKAIAIASRSAKWHYKFQNGFNVKKQNSNNSYYKNNWVQNPNSNQKNKNISNKSCYRCRQRGHLAADCNVETVYQDQENINVSNSADFGHVCAKNGSSNKSYSIQCIEEANESAWRKRKGRIEENEDEEIEMGHLSKRRPTITFDMIKLPEGVDQGKVDYDLLKAIGIYQSNEFLINSSPSKKLFLTYKKIGVLFQIPVS